MKTVFGFGLSYTTFAYSDLWINPSTIKDAEGITVEAKVKNAGRMPGQEVVQLYVHERGAMVERPEKELKAFTTNHDPVTAIEASPDRKRSRRLLVLAGNICDPKTPQAVAGGINGFQKNIATCMHYWHDQYVLGQGQSSLSFTTRRVVTILSEESGRQHSA
jgi:hypothetical protein